MEGLGNVTTTIGPTAGPLGACGAGVGGSGQHGPGAGLRYLCAGRLCERGLPDDPLPAVVPSLPGTAAGHLHQVRLSAAGVQPMCVAQLRLLPDVLVALAAAAGLVALQGA